MARLWMLFLVLVPLALPAQDWSVVQKYYKPGFQARLDKLPLPAIPDNDHYMSQMAHYWKGLKYVPMRQHDVFAVYPAQGNVPIKVWDRFDGLVMNFQIRDKGDHYLIEKSDCMVDSIAPHDWSGCSKDLRSSTDPLTLRKDSVMDWIDLYYLVTDFPPLPMPYPFPRLRPLRWELEPTFWVQWGYAPQGRMASQHVGRTDMNYDMDISYAQDSLGRDTLVQVHGRWVNHRKGKPDSVRPRYLESRHRLVYDSRGRLEYHGITKGDKGGYIYDKPGEECFTDQIYVYDNRGLAVARVQVWPDKRGIVALTALRYDAQDRLVRKTTYLVKNNRTVGEWVETMAWKYDARGRVVQKTQYCNDPLIKKLMKDPATEWLKWFITRW
jgi:hypothetical protein